MMRSILRYPRAGGVNPQGPPIFLHHPDGLLAPDHLPGALARAGAGSPGSQNGFLDRRHRPRRALTGSARRAFDNEG
jgi:hypothetical protein